MKLLSKVKLYALEIVNLIDNGNLEDFKTFGIIGDKIEKLGELRLEVVRYPVIKNKGDSQ